MTTADETATRHSTGLSASAMKLIAAVAMLIDHIGLGIWYRLPKMGYLVPAVMDEGRWRSIYQVMRGIGRLAFPVFCFFLVEGFFHTSSRPAYVRRLAVFALISQWPFQYAFEGYSGVGTNVFFTLAIGFLAIWAMERAREKWRHPAVCAVAWLAILAAASWTAIWLETDYAMQGVVLIAVMYVFRARRHVAMPLGFAVMQFQARAWETSWNMAYLTGFALPLVYNGRRGFGMKYFFYVFYPAHLGLIYLVWKFVL